VAPHYPGPCAEVLDRIGQLYAVERECPPRVGAATDTADTDLREQRARLRAQRSAPLVGAFVIDHDHYVATTRSLLRPSWRIGRGIGDGDRLFVRVHASR